MSRCLAAALLALAACLPTPALADLAEIKARGTLKVIAVREEAPEMFSFAASGEPGFEREIIEGFARLHDLEFQAVPANTSAERIQLLAGKAGDVIIGIIETEPRRKLVNFTSEVLPARHIVITLKSHREVKTVEEFRAERIGVVKGTSWAQAAVDAGVPAGSMQSFAERHSALEALREGKITATVMSLSDFTLALRRYPEIRAGLTLGASASAAFAMRKSDPQLLAALDAYLDNLRKGPSWGRLVVKYFGEQALTVLGRQK